MLLWGREKGEHLAGFAVEVLRLLQHEGSSSSSNSLCKMLAGPWALPGTVVSPD